MLFAIAACSRLPALTPDLLVAAEQKWNAHRPPSYELVVEMSGDRVETGRFEIEVQSGEIANARRNGLPIPASTAQAYTVDGLFHILEQELGLAERPATLGAPEGYSVYTTARFDDATGRLIRYRRIVGGTSNSIDVNVVGFTAK